MNCGLDSALLTEIASHSHTNVQKEHKAYLAIIGDLSAKSRVHDFILLLAVNRVRQQFRSLHKFG